MTLLNRRALLATLPALLAACEGGRSPRSVRLMLAGSRNAEINGVWVWARAFAKVLEANGFSPSYSFNGSMGSEADRIELIALGLAQLNDAGSNEILAYTDLYSAAGLPFLFETPQQFDRFLAHPDFRTPLQAKLAHAGLYFADAARLGGMTGLFTSNRAVRRIEDLKGRRIRAMGRTDLLMTQALGASGVQVAWEEVPQALETGIAEGYFNPPIAPVMFGHGAHLHYFLDLKSSAGHRVILLSRRWLDSLNAEQTQIVEAALAAAHRENRAWAEASTVRERQALEEIGIEVIEPDPAERQRFAERVRDAYDRMASPESVAAALEITNALRNEPQ